MLAASRDSQKVFLFDPRMGMSVPILLDLNDLKIRVAIPEVAELEEDFASMDALEEIKDAVQGHDQLVDAAANFSRFYSKHFRSELDRSDMTITQLRTLIEQHYSQVDKRHEPRRNHFPAIPAFAFDAGFET